MLRVLYFCHTTCHNTQSESSDDNDKSASLDLQTQKSESKVSNGKDKAKQINITTGTQYSFTETQEEEIAQWIESRTLLFDIKHKLYKDKTLRRQLWETKAEEYGVNYDSIQKWYLTQRTRFSKMRDGKQKEKSLKRSGDGLSSGDEEEPFLSEEFSEHDSDRDRFIRRVFGFLRPHIRRHKKDIPASFKDKLALAETGELAGSDDSTMTSTPSSFVDKSREITNTYTGYSKPRPPSRIRTAPEFVRQASNDISVAESSLGFQDRLVQYITKEQPVNRATPFCHYLESELGFLHDACLEPAYEEITTVLNHYRKMSRHLRAREAAGDRIRPLEDVPTVFQTQQLQRPVNVIPVCTPGTYPRVSQLQQTSSLPRKATSSPSEFEPGPSLWPRNPPQASLWGSQECGYVHQANQQYIVEQKQQKYHTPLPARTSTRSCVRSPRQSIFSQLPPPSPISVQQCQLNVTQDATDDFLNPDHVVNYNSDIDLLDV